MVTAALGLVLGSLGALSAPQPAAPASYPTAEQTRRELQSVCERLADSHNLYFGRRMIPDLRARLEREDLNPEERWMVAERLAHDLHRTGDLVGAIEVLDEALASLRATDALEGRDEKIDVALLSLATAHLQLGEERNCIVRHAAASCILPVAPTAIHPEPQHVRKAGDYYAEVVRRSPYRLRARWLLNLARMLSGDFPDGVPPALRVPAEMMPVASGEGRWPEISAAVGIHGSDLAGGAAIEDFDGDGLLDIVTSSIDPCEPMKAWRNDGRGGFEDVSAAWGLDGQLGGLNLTTGDFDGDGMVDVLVLRGGWFGSDGKIRNSLLRNDIRREAGRFVDVTAAAGMAWPAYPTQTAAWADYDGDGDLDLYVGNEANLQTTDPQQIYGAAAEAYPSQLFRNNGDGTFTDVAREAGVTNMGFAKGVAWGDFDDDGRPDLFVSNIGENRLYRNNGDGTFTDVARQAGVVGPYRSFATWFFDYDNDGDLDLFVADYGTPVEEVTASYFGEEVEGGHPILYRNDGGGRFTDVSREVGFTAPTLPMGANYGDLDNDGWPDIYLGTGVPDFHALVPNVMYRNDGSGGFVDVTLAEGWGHLQKGHGIAFGDLDNDGDQDLFQQLGGAFPYDDYRNVLYENPGAGNRWITLRLAGRKSSSLGVGSRIAVRVRQGDAVRTIHALVGTGGSFGASSHQAEIGLGAAEAIEEVVVRWAGSGTVDRYAEVALDRFYRVVEGSPELEPLDPPRLTLGAPR